MIEAVVGAIVALLVAVTATVGTVSYLAKRLGTATASQNRVLIDAALKNMEANTAAIHVNSAATTMLTRMIEQSIVVRDERDKSLFRTLDRIENHVSKGGK